MTFGTLDFRAIQNAAAAMPVETAHFGVLSSICLLLFVGATGKSAQIPLYVWLPDAMEGPTPVSALIHAATMVTAGVYMLGRNAVLFSHAPQVMTIVAIVGVLTALMAATIGLVQYDIKRVLAYSTVSQLGYMFTAMGVGAFSAGAFHLMTHAFFKALLFLGSGSVIHAMGGEQDMRRMGGLRKYLPVTFVTMMLGTLAIAGIFPFAGFFSKDEILFRAFVANKVVWVLAVAAAFMTAFYMFRLMAMTFLGGYRGPAWEAAHDAHGGHEPMVDDARCARRPRRSRCRRTWARRVARAARIAVADDAAAPGAGHRRVRGRLRGHSGRARRRKRDRTLSRAELHRACVGRSRRACARSRGGAAAAAEPAEHEEAHVSRGVELGLMGFSLLVAVGGILLARKFYVTSPEIADNLALEWSGPHKVLSNKYYVDELYDATVIGGTFAAGRGLWAVDRNVVDGAVNGSGWLTIVSAWFSGLTDRTVVDGLVNLVGRICEEGSFWFRRVQTGLVQNYALLMLVRHLRVRQHLSVHAVI